MRIWCGKDIEHNLGYGIMTLFVESENPDINKISEILSECDYGVSNVYFGAGEVDITNWEFLDSLYKISDAFVVGIETSQYISEDIIELFDFVVFRIRIPNEWNNLNNKVYMKYRTDDKVGVMDISKFKVTSLDTLNNGQYENDVEIYRED